MIVRTSRTLLLVLAALASLVSARAARAQATPEAAKVIARYLDATGGAAASAAEQTLYMHGRLEAFGFNGTIESWSARPDRQYSRTELGPFNLAEGVDGATSWRTDPTTGRLVKLTDRDSLDAQISTWFSMERWSEPGLSGGRATVAGHERDSSGTYTVLAITAPGQSDAKPRRLWFADATGLLAREETPRDQSFVITELSDYRRSGGRMRAYTTTTRIPSMPMNQMKTVTDSFAINIDVSRVAFAMPDTTHVNALHWLRTEGVATLPFDYRARHVWLRASIDGGREEDFLFDTGASVTVLDSSWAAQHGIQVQGMMQAAGAGASGSISFATLPSLAVKGPDGDGIEVHDLRVGVLTVTPMFSRYFWRNFAGILGYDVISRFVVTIDYDSGRLVLHDPKTFRYDGRAPALPMKLNGTVPSIEATLDGKYAGQFRLDVGSSSTVDIHTPFARRYGLERRLRDAREVSGAGFGGTFSSVLGRMRSMTLGASTWRDPMVTVARAEEGAFASEDFAGNIGNRILERFRVTLDYEGRHVWLEPGKRIADRDRFTRTGLMLGWSPDRIDAISVLPDSPAAKAGLREGETVTSVQGKPAGEWDPIALDDVLENQPDGTRVSLTVNRGGKAVPLVIVLREMLK